MAFAANAVWTKRRLGQTTFNQTLSFTTTIRDGDARAKGVLARHLKSKKLPTSFACAEQVHGDKIVIVPKLSQIKKYESADGLLTDQPHQPLAIFTADCVPVFLADRKSRVVGVLHAGWRGVRSRILKKSVRLIQKKWGIPAKDLHVWFGPSIGPCCFEVQWDVAQYFPKTRSRAKDRRRVDLSKELRIQARALGIQFRAKASSLSCTMHNNQFHSYRRNQTTKRLASVILKDDDVKR